MKRSFPVVDADGHVIERIASWENFWRRRIAAWKGAPTSMAAQDLER